MSRLTLLMLFFLALVSPKNAFAQNDPAPSDTNQPKQTEPNEPRPVGSAEANPQVEAVSGFFSGFDYDPRGRRDPFAQPVEDVPVAPGPSHGPLLPLQRFELAQLRLTGILWDVRSPKALLQDPNGKTHLVTPNTKVGPRNGYVAVIREGEIVVVETIEQDGRLVSTSQVVKIAK